MKEEQLFPGEPERNEEADRLLEQFLRSDVMSPLSSSFAARVGRKAARRLVMRQHLLEFLSYTAAILLPLGVLGVVLYFSGREQLQEWAAWWDTARPFLVGGGGILFFLLVADKVLLPWLYFFYGSHKGARGK